MNLVRRPAPALEPRAVTRKRHEMQVHASRKVARLLARASALAGGAMVVKP